MRVVTAEQMRAADAAAVARVGEIALMRAAGEALAEAIARISPLPRRLVAFAGPGNNGGDAFAAFAAVDSPCEKVIYALPSPATSDGRRDAEARARIAGVLTRPFPDSRQAADAALHDADVALDALFGTGARPVLGEALVPVVEALNASPAHVLAVDIPTGVDATTGSAAEPSVHADTTVTLGAAKLGLLLEPARANVGTLYVGDIGLADAAGGDLEGTRFAVLDDAEFLRLLPHRSEESDKRIAGAPLVLAGSEQFPGAAVLCARGAARAGAGYVMVAASAAAAPPIRAHLVEQVVVSFDERNVEGTIESLLHLTSRSNAVAIGPGLALSDTVGEIVRGFIERLERPFVADASALYHLGKHLHLLRGKACVVTPHAGEFARLSGEGTIAPGTRQARLRAFVARTGVTTLLKGNATLIDDGTTIHVNVTGTSALATAGTGDVLSGVIATLLSQGLAPVDAARVGAYWHGLAGRYASATRPVGVVAGDVADCLGLALPHMPEPRPGSRLLRVM
jgi:NAD(P)H-hydrate epimerase